MATQAEQQQLIDTLKFTPRTYKISDVGLWRRKGHGHCGSQGLGLLHGTLGSTWSR
jgi:hypothetical protein